MNLNLIDFSDADNSTVQGDKKSFVVPSALKERILSTKGKNNTTQKYLLLSDDKLVKLWLRRKFIFGTNVSATPITKPAPIDTKFSSPSSSDICIGNQRELEDVANQEIDNIGKERSVD